MDWGYQNSAIWGPQPIGNLQPQDLNSGATDWGDVMLGGIVNAANNVLWRGSQTVAQQPVQPGITIGASGNLMQLLLIAGVVWLVAKG